VTNELTTPAPTGTSPACVRCAVEVGRVPSRVSNDGLTTYFSVAPEHSGLCPACCAPRALQHAVEDAVQWVAAARFDLFHAGLSREEEAEAEAELALAKAERTRAEAAARAGGVDVVAVEGK
jgi:hypothetical protein